MLVFIDGRSGTTGLRIQERLEKRPDVQMIVLPEKDRHDNEKRREAINSADAAFLCLPDAAAIEAASMAENGHTVIIDTSTAHRTAAGWAYGFPELGMSFRQAVKAGKRIAVPGCHASGFIALAYPLIEAGVLPRSALLSCFSITGYSGGGKKMIAEYEGPGRSVLLDAPRQYGTAQTHKHLPEMQKITGIDTAPVFSPLVADFYSGMEVTVPLHRSQLLCGPEKLREIYAEKYTGPIVRYAPDAGEGGFMAANSLAGKDAMEVSVEGNGERILLVARYDNLGKGASGAAMQCMNIVAGVSETAGLDL